MKKVKKLNVSKKRQGCCSDDMPKTRSLSETKQKKDKPSQSFQNSNILPKKKEAVTSSHNFQVISSNKCEKNSSVNEFCVNSLLIKSSDDKENVMPSVKCVQTRSSTKKNVSVQENSVYCKEKNKLNVPCYDKVSFADDSGGKVCTAAGNSSRKLIFPENSATKQEDDVYNFDDDESSTNRMHKKRKRKKVLNSSDEEYVPPKSMRSCKHRQLSHAHLRHEIQNPDGKSEMEVSQVTQLLPEMNDERVQQALCCADDSSLTCNRSLRPLTGESKLISATCDSHGLSHNVNFSHAETTRNNSGVKPVVGLGRSSSFSVLDSDFVPSHKRTSAKHRAALATSSTENIPTSTTKTRRKSRKLRQPTACTTPREFVENNCSLVQPLAAPFMTTTEDDSMDLWSTDDQPGAFKGFPTSCVCTVDSIFCRCSNSAARNLGIFSTREDDKKCVAKNFNVSANKNAITCGGHALSEKTNIDSSVNTGFSRNFSTTDLATSENSYAKDICSNNKVSFTSRKIYDDDWKLHVKPVCLIHRSVPFSTCGSDGMQCEGPSSKHVSESDASNKENVPTNHNLSETPEQSRRLWRPAAYVSPKPYVERNSSFEDTFDSPSKTITETNTMNPSKTEEKSKCICAQDREFCGACTSVSSPGCTHSSECSEHAVESSRCQETVGNIDVLSTQSLRTEEGPYTKVGSAGNNVAHTVVLHQHLCANGGKDSVVDDIDAGDCVPDSAVMQAESCAEVVQSSVGNGHASSSRPIGCSSDKPRTEARRNSEVVSQDIINVDEAGECNVDDYFGFGQEEPEEELLSPIRLQPNAPKHQLTIATSSTPDHGTSTALQGRKPWRPALSGASVKPLRKVQASMHSFLSKSAPQFRRDVSTVVVPEAVSSISVQQPFGCPRDVAAAVSTPEIFSVDKLSGPLEEDFSSSRQPPRRVYSHPRKVRTHQLESFQEESPVEDKGENVSRKVAKKRSRKQNEAEKEMKNFLSAINNEFETIENFELCVE